MYHNFPVDIPTANYTKQVSRGYALSKHHLPSDNLLQTTHSLHVVCPAYQANYVSILLYSYTIRSKHPTKVHVWAGISRKGRTGICIFEGIMKKELYVEVLEHTLLPFARSAFPVGYKFTQDNDPKHVSNHAKEWMERHGVTWWKSPPESLDLNTKENLWDELKE